MLTAEELKRTPVRGKLCAAQEACRGKQKVVPQSVSEFLDLKSIVVATVKKKTAPEQANTWMVGVVGWLRRELDQDKRQRELFVVVECANE